MDTCIRRRGRMGKIWKEGWDLWVVVGNLFFSLSFIPSFFFFFCKFFESGLFVCFYPFSPSFYFFGVGFVEVDVLFRVNVSDFYDVWFSLLQLCWSIWIYLKLEQVYRELICSLQSCIFFLVCSLQSYLLIYKCVSNLQSIFFFLHSCLLSITILCLNNYF